jgi:hypothetical protein
MLAAEWLQRPYALYRDRREPLSPHHLAEALIAKKGVTDVLNVTFPVSHSPCESLAVHSMQ